MLYCHDLYFRYRCPGQKFLWGIAHLKKLILQKSQYLQRKGRSFTFTRAFLKACAVAEWYLPLSQIFCYSKQSEVRNLNSYNFSSESATAVNDLISSSVKRANVKPFDQTGFSRWKSARKRRNKPPELETRSIKHYNLLQSEQCSSHLW